MNQTLKHAIQKYVGEKQDKWDTYLDGILYNYRTSVHASTGRTPFEVMYGRRAVLPVELSSCGHNEMGSLEMKQILEAQQAFRNDLNDAVHENIERAQKRQKRCYDMKKNAHKSFTIGSRVLLKNNKNCHRMGGQLDVKWTGPYIVTEDVGKGRVRLQNMSSGVILKNIYHGANLKIYADPRKQRRQPTGDAIPQEQQHDGDVTQQEEKRFVSLSIDDRKRLAKKLTLPSTVYYPLPKLVTETSIPVDVAVIKGDGNCFFRAISYVLTGSTAFHKEVRKAIVDHMQSRDE